MIVSVVLAIIRCIFEAKTYCKQKTKIENKNGIIPKNQNDFHKK
jgi:hypothetical protein